MNTPFADYVQRRELEPSSARVFPCVPGGKAPACAGGHRAATDDMAQLRAWAAEMPDANVGMDPNSIGLSVVDIDGAQGEDAWFALQIEHGFAPDTFTVRTPRVGRHLYFRGQLPTSAGRLGPHLDTRGAGRSYVLIPPSVTPDGKYSLVDERKPVPLPDWVVARLPTSRRPARLVASPCAPARDTSVNVWRARTALRTLPPAIEGEGGDSHTYEAAMIGWDLGLSKEKVLELMLEEWNCRCQPPWDAEELSVKIANAYSYARGERGSAAVGCSRAAFGAAAERLTMLPAPSDAGPVSFGDVLRRSVSPVDELVPGLVERRTVTFLSAPGGSHKSRLALQWGLCIDSGTPVFGRTVQKATFVYLSYEDHPDEVARRAQAISVRLQLPEGGAGEYWDLTACDGPLATVLESGEVRLEAFHSRLSASLRKIPGQKFLVVDGTYNALRFAGSAKINETSVMAGIALLQRLCIETDTTILALWHPSQAGQERGDASGWSVAWHNAPRSRLSLARVRDCDEAFELRIEKRNHGPKGAPITLFWSDGVLLPRTEIGEVEQSARFIEACVAVAVTAAEHGAPIRKQNRLSKWMLDEIEAAAGYRPRDRDVKEVLATALRHQRLRYVSHTRHRTAGYYPFDPCVAAELACEATRVRREAVTAA